MEEKQLNFSAPLLSVRRLSSKLASPDRENGKTNKNLPPIRKHSVPSYKSDFQLGEVTKPAAVPFMWEQIPGRPKSRSGLLLGPHEGLSITPRLPPGRVLDIVPLPPSDAFPSNDSGTKLGGSKEGINEEGDSDLESGDDAYSDALDTLSTAESCSLNCSVSGLSGSDGPDVKPSGTFSTDPQTRDFMMRRFLPAAKAMALKPPQYASRKQPVAPEQPRQVRKVICGDRMPPVNQYGPNIVPLHCEDVEEEQSEDEDDDYDDSGNRTAKPCALIPLFCLKNSLSLLNPMPGVKVRSHIPRTARTKDHSQKLNKHAWNSYYKRSVDHEVQSFKMDEVEQKLTVKSGQLIYSSDSHPTNGSSPHRHLEDGGASPSQNEAARSSFHEAGKFLGVPKEIANFKANRISLYNEDCNNFEEVSCQQRNNFGSGSESPAVEKTLYIDSVNIVEIPRSYSSSSDSKGLMCSADENFEALEENRGTKETATAESSIQDIKCLNAATERAILKPKVSEPVDFCPSSSLDASHLRGRTDTMVVRQDQGLEQESRSLECFKGPASENLHISNEQIPETDDQVNSSVSSLQSPLPPPLPKSPSESWLSRTLPSISSKNSFSHSHLGSQFHLNKQAPKTSPTGTKWETIVKTSKLHYDHLRYSEELITHVSQQS